MVRAGTLNRRVTLQRRTESQGSTGEVTWTWADVATVWAAIEPLATGNATREALMSSQVQASMGVRIRIRHRRGVTPKMRAVYVEQGSPLYTRYYDIEAVVDPREGRRELHLMCKERQADGWRD